MIKMFGNYYFSDDFLFLLFLIGGAVAIFLVFISFESSSKEEKEREFSLFETLTKGFASNLIKNDTDVVHIFEGLFKNSNQGIAFYLKKFIGKIIRSDGDDIKNKNLIKDKITLFINEFEKQHPFSGLPTYERNLLEDLDLFVRESNRDGITKKINELKILILTRNDDFKKIEKTNKWSVPLAIFGLVLSIILFLVPYFYSPVSHSEVGMKPSIQEYNSD